MKNGLSLLLLALSLSSCAYQPQVTYNTSPIGASVYEADTNRYLGITPLVVAYNPSKAHYANGCYQIKGVTASWASGTKSSTTPTISLCGKSKAYNVSIPYLGGQDHLAYDLKIEPLALDAIRKQNAKNQPVSNGEAIVWASLISGTGNLVGVALAPTPAYQPIQQVTYPDDNQSVSGCTSDFSCSSGQICVKPPLSSSGQCMNSVNSLGISNYQTPNPSSIGVNNKGQCFVSSDCPIGFTCDDNLKACVQ